MRSCKIYAPHNIRYIQDGRWNLCAYQKYMRQMCASIRKLAPKLLLFGLGRISNFWLLPSLVEELSFRWCCLSFWAPRPPILYGRRLSHTVPAVVPARLAKISASCPNICGRIYFHHFLGKNQKHISAHKCPITSLQICTWSQKLTKFSCNTFKPLIRGRPRFWPRTLKIVQIQQWGVRGWGRGRSLPSANPDNVAAGGATDARGEGGEGRVGVG